LANAPIGQWLRQSINLRQSNPALLSIRQSANDEIAVYHFE
jgi:hypothetical protein